MRIPIGYQDDSGFYCDSPFMEEYRRRVRRNRVIVVVASIAALLLCLLWRLL